MDSAIFSSTTDGDDLSEFLQWWLDHRPMNTPPENTIDKDDNIYGVVLYRQPPYQVQLFIMPANTEAAMHIHPNMDSFEVFVSGDINLIVDGKLYRPKKFAAPIRIKETSWHGGSFGERGGCFLSVQKWLNGKEPTSAVDDWLDENHNTVGTAWYNS